METLPPSATESRHLPHARNPAKSSSDPWESRRHLIRAVAKKLAAADDPLTCRRLGFACALDGGLAADAETPCPARAGKHASVRTHHFEAQLQGRGAASEEMLPGGRRVAAAASATSHRHRRPFKRDRRYYTPAELDDDVRLAKSSAVVVRMPDNRRAVRTEAAHEVADRAQVAALYETGLLYRDASPRDRRLTLDNIPHDEPMYVVRTAKPRLRKHGQDALGGGGGLHLSFSDLGDEESLVQYVMALTASEADAAGASSTLSSPTLRAMQEMDDASLETWVVLDRESL
ncbi:hypothetical protein CCM_05546 [Cordyceps militaris CM01]|uniref:Uncharacterized protein n=1 Tax=Cordyceps militaris (strain CM01) TaxID=983644 RepID=G3JKA4_CORMM|nr:uncharacterized protein CCM_05546 [Cordyceps militaris CM01]EGX91388.1 hypothetical protein CCM_05546 [Cordyceps militaris CM01]